MAWKSFIDLEEKKFRGFVERIFDSFVSKAEKAQAPEEREELYKEFLRGSRDEWPELFPGGIPASVPAEGKDVKEPVTEEHGTGFVRPPETGSASDEDPDEKLLSSMEQVGRLNRSFTEAPREGKKVCYVLPSDLLCVTERNWITEINKLSRDVSASTETVLIVDTARIFDEEEKRKIFDEAIDGKIAEGHKVYSAVPALWRDRPSRSGERSVAFSGNIRCAAALVVLRAMARGGEQAAMVLRELYRALTGDFLIFPDIPLSGEAFEDFVRSVAYSLPPAEISDTETLPRVSRALKTALLSA